MQSYAAIVTTRQVTRPVVKELRLRTTPEELASRITAVAPLNTVLIDITVRDTEPRRAARIANAVAERFSAVVERLETPKRAVQRSGKNHADDAPPASPVSLGVTQEAVAPVGPVSPRPLLNLAAGVFGGLLLGAGLVALRETLDTTLKTSEALGEFTALPGLGTIPYDRNVPKQPLVSVDVHSHRAEAFRKLRTNLQFSQVDEPPRIIAVTSSVPGEGKTNTAVNLALSLAETGLSTCLVDGDLRRPVCGVDLRSRPGRRSDHRAHRTGPYRGRDAAGGGRLSVLASGAVPPNPTELLASARMKEVLRELADTYEVVIVDTAPLLPVADTLGLASFAQGALLVVCSAKTSRDQVRTAAIAGPRECPRPRHRLQHGSGARGAIATAPTGRTASCPLLVCRTPEGGRRDDTSRGREMTRVLFRLHGQRAPLGARRAAAGREASARFGRTAGERRNAGAALVRHGRPPPGRCWRNWAVTAPASRPARSAHSSSRKQRWSSGSRTNTGRPPYGSCRRRCGAASP